MEGIYKVKWVPTDLSSEETVLQIADTLDNLNGIIDDVFSRINARINHNMEKTNKLKKRIEVSRNKAEQLLGVQKAIKVFSSAKYPSSITHEHYKSVFGLDGYRHQPREVTLTGKSQGQAVSKDVQEKLHFYHVKIAEPRPAQKKDFDLTTIMDSVKTVGQLLVFNTDESPYLGAPSKPAYVPKISPNVERNVLDDAPSSIMRREVMKREADEYMYAPGIGMVPELEMPLDLPHLPGIAGDVQFSIAADGSIAPSVVTSPQSPVTSFVPHIPETELPDIQELVVPLPDVPDAPPPPVPVPVPVPVEALPPPPPPPPPPPMEIVAPAGVEREQPPASAPKAPAPIGDAHSNLMAAIRQAGGAGRAKLRPAAEPAPAKTTKGGGDLMADLHAKLSMRRRGISGAERQGSVLEALANVIPEPDPVSAQDSSTDEDWE